MSKVILETPEQREHERELALRLDDELRHLGSTLSPLNNAAWRGYLAACIEWGVISVSAHDRLNEKLPPLNDDPSIRILLGREEAEPS